MKLVRFRAQVDREKCNGCKLCEKICLSETIKVLGKKAVVDDDMCLACTRCLDICSVVNAITMVPRPEPKQVGTLLADVDEAAVRELCLKAHRLPHELICVCTSTFAGEIAAAILKGARSFKEVSLKTGVLTGCQEFCVPVIQRMLKAHGVDLTKSGGYLRYDQTLSMWDIPAEVRQRHPEYYFEEDLALASRVGKG